MNFIEEMRAKAKSDPRKLVLPEGYEARTLKAGRILLDEGFASEVTLLGSIAQIEAEAKNLVERLKAYTVSADAWNRRLFFICNRYTVPLNSLHLWERMNKPSKQYFEEYK